MKDARLDILLIKYFKKDISSSEMDELAVWVSKNKRLFEESVKVNALINKSFRRANSEEACQRFLSHIGEPHRLSDTGSKYPIWLKYAAVLLIGLLIGGVYFFNRYSGTIDVPDAKAPAVLLTLSDGTVKKMDLLTPRKIQDKKSNVVMTQSPTGLVYETAVEKSGQILQSEMLYNELSVPYGVTYRLKLPDGTKVVLNAGSSIRFPVAFNSVSPRKIFLKGEAFFEVTKKDDKQPFIVSTRGVNTQVLGTRFNVSSYEGDSLAYTVLTEGSVKLYKEEATAENANATPLQPGYKASWDGQHPVITVNKVDIQQYTAWMEGHLVFEATPFQQLLKKLERHYDVTIDNQYPALYKYKFTGTFKNETIIQVLQTIRRYRFFKYTINRDKITITKL